MSAQRPLTRRTQLELLTSACLTHEPVRLELQEAEPDAAQAEGHLLACDRGSLLVELASQPGVAAAPASRVSARFGHRGRRFTFSTTVLAGVTLPAAARERAAVRLAMPLVLRERAARMDERVRPAGNAPVYAELLVVGRDSPPQSCRIVDVSAGGLGCELATDKAGLLTGHALIRVRAAGRDAPRDCEFIARIVHANAISEQESRVGLAFVGLDDATELDARLRRLQNWITDARRAEGETVETRQLGGRGPC